MATTDRPLANVTAADVLAWGKAQPAETVIGVCRNPRACLIASYALHVLNAAITVDPSPTGNGSYRRLDGVTRYALPLSLNRLALTFDALSAAWNKTERMMHPADLDRLAVQS